MSSAFGTALSALNADTTAIDVVGNNLANLNTTGFKASEIDFQDVMAQTLGVGANNGQVGMGVGQVSAFQQFTQGTVTSTNAPLDAALQGNGFFVVKDSNNDTLYTRAGDFQLDASGNLLTASGQNVQGWMAVNGVLNPNGPTTNLTLPVGATEPPVATTNMSMSINLNAAAPTTGTGSTFTAPIQIYDSEGTPHTLSATFSNAGSNTWNYTVTIPATDLTAGGNTTVATGSMTFDSNGNLTSPAAGAPIAIAATGLADGAGDLNISWNLYSSTGTANITQYAEASAVSGPAQNGNAAGSISNIGIENGGLIQATYTNGQQVVMGQLAVASITNPTSLVAVGDNNLEASAATAQAAIGASGTGDRGTIVGGSLESSTTDMASEFTQLLTYERSYQAASRVITTSDQLAQDTVNLIQG